MQEANQGGQMIERAHKSRPHSMSIDLARLYSGNNKSTKQPEPRNLKLWKWILAFLGERTADQWAVPEDTHCLLYLQILFLDCTPPVGEYGLSPLTVLVSLLVEFTECT